MPKTTATATPLTRATKNPKADTRGKPLGPQFLAFLVALLLLAGVVGFVEGRDRNAAWALVALLLVGVLLVNAGQTLQAAAQIIDRLQLSKSR